MGERLHEIRCECGKLICKACGNGSIEAKCPRCKKIFTRGLETSDLTQKQAAKEYVAGND